MLPRRTPLVNALQVGAARVWHEHPCIATAGHYEANAYITAKEREYGEGWPLSFKEWRRTFTLPIYQQWTDNSPLSFEAGMTIGLQIIDESRLFDKDAFSVTHRSLQEVLGAQTTHNHIVLREKLFGCAMKGFDVIKPQFEPSLMEIAPDRAIIDGSRNSAFEMGVGLVLYAALSSEVAATIPKRALV